jgi:hypothetical protein
MYWAYFGESTATFFVWFSPCSLARGTNLLVLQDALTEKVFEASESGKPERSCSCLLVRRQVRLSPSAYVARCRRWHRSAGLTDPGEHLNLVVNRSCESEPVASLRQATG